MNKLNAITGGIVLTMGLWTNAQNTPAENVDECKKFRSLYYQYLKQKMYDDATDFWSKAYTHCGGTEGGNLDVKFFKNGRVAYLQRLKKVQDSDTLQINNIKDTLAWIYEERMKIAPDPIWALDYASMLVKGKSQDYAKIDSLYTNIHVIKEKASGSHLRTYFKYLIMSKFNTAPQEEKAAEREKIVSAYLQLSDYCAAAIKVAKTNLDVPKNVRKLKSYTTTQDYLDKYFLKIAKDCEVLTPVLDKKFATIAEDEAGLKQLNKLIALMERQKCTDSETYANYVTESVKRNPTSSGYAGLGRIQLSKGQEKEAIASFEKAVEMESEAEKKEEYILALAKAQYRAKQFRTAFSTAKKVEGSVKGSAMKICGDCIAATANGCGESTFERKANYWLANDYYRRAAQLGENVSGSKYLGRAPKETEVFENGYAKGSAISLSCWSESTTIR